MKTIVKYFVIKSKDYQFGRPLCEEELDETTDYFDRMPKSIQFQNLEFKINSKELSRKYIADENEESQTIIVKVIAA